MNSEWNMRHTARVAPELPHALPRDSRWKCNDNSSNSSNKYTAENSASTITAPVIILFSIFVSLTRRRERKERHARVHIKYYWVNARTIRKQRRILLLLPLFPMLFIIQTCVVSLFSFRSPFSCLLGHTRIRT